MPQSVTTVDGVTLIDPGAYVALNVIAGQGNIATAGVVTILGESDEGPGFLDEEDLSQVFFSPDQQGRVIAKYGSGRLVDAFSKLITAANDPNIIGGVTLVRMIKTNMSAKADGSIALRKLGTPTFATALARKAGFPGNLIKYKSDVARAEVAPTTGLFCYTPRLTGSIDVAVRANGGELLSYTIAPKTAPDALVTALEDVSKNLHAKGGRRKLVEPSAGLTLAATAVDANTLLVTLQSGNQWSAAPVAGDVAVIPASGDYGAAQDSEIAGTANANVGTYIVQTVTNSLTSATLTLKKVFSTGTLVNASGTTSADFKDIILYSKVELKNISGDSRQFMQDVFGTYAILANNGSQFQLQTPVSTTWNVTPKAGDIIAIVAMFGTITPGFYQVTAGTTTTVSATRLSEGSSGTGTGSPVYSSGTEPLVLETAVVSGVGKTYSIEGDVSTVFRTAAGADAGFSNKRFTSAAEYRNQITISKGTLSNTYQGGGDIVLEVGATEEDSHISVQSDKIEFLIGTDVQFTATYKQFKTMSDLASYISSQTGWSASVPTAKFNSSAPSTLDEGSYTASGLAAHKNARLKHDAFDWEQAVNADGLVAWTAALPGLPEATDSFQFLANGAKNGTTSATVVAAIDSIEALDTNFAVTLFSQDATDDIADEETESSSTYTVDAINAYMSSHVLKMSQLEQRKNRIAIGSKAASYTDVKEAAGGVANYRFGMTFEPVKGQTVLSESKMFQPWMAAIVAAGMSAAAGYKGIVKKFANINGLGAVDGWSPVSLGDRKDALQAGLLFMEPVRTGGFRWVSDQTTYSVDNNFVYNSLQAVYVSDLMALTLIERYDRLAVGKSVADISAAAALSILEAEMFNFKRLKWITSSDDAPKGFKNASAQINGPALEIKVEAKIAGLIYFVPISLSLSQVSQTATQG